MKELQSEAALFEVQVPDFPLVTQCRNENKMLKQLWDYVFLVRSQIIDTSFTLIKFSLMTRTSVDEWKTTPWSNIDVENMDMECKKFAKV